MNLVFLFKQYKVVTKSFTAFLVDELVPLFMCTLGGMGRDERPLAPTISSSSTMLPCRDAEALIVLSTVG